MISYNFRKIFTTMISSDDDDNWEPDNTSSDSKRMRSEKSKYKTRKKNKSKTQQQTSNFKDFKRKRTKNSEPDSRKKQKTATSLIGGLRGGGGPEQLSKEKKKTQFCMPTNSEWYAAVEASKDPKDYTLENLISNIRRHQGLPWNVQHVPIKFLSQEQVEAGQMQKTLSDFKPSAVNNGAVLLVIPGDGPTLKPEAYDSDSDSKLTVSHKTLKQNEGELLTPIENIKLSKKTLKKFLETTDGACGTSFLDEHKKRDIDSVAIESVPFEEGSLIDPNNFLWNMFKENGTTEVVETPMEGISVPSRYHSSAYSCFPAHQEEGRLLSVNLSVHPRPRAEMKDEEVVFKVFFVVQEKAYLDLMKEQSEKISQCNVFWRHKEDFPDLELILKSKIEVKIALQFPGSIFFSSGIHWGFNTGLPTT